MDLKGLDQLLAIQGGSLSLAVNSLPGSGLDQLLTAYNSGQPLVINNAQKQTGAGSITVAGTTRYLNADTQVTGLFGLDRAGNPTVALRLQLIGETAGVNPWKFSTSFPHMPPFPDTQPRYYLDQLEMRLAAYVLATVAGQDQATGASYAPGLSFVGLVRPLSLLGPFGGFLSGGTEFTIAGPITMPAANPTPAPLSEQLFPWDAPGPVPGIDLNVSFGGSFSLAGLNCHHFGLRIYSPLTTDWLNANPTYGPNMALLGHVDGSSVKTEVYAVLVPGSPRLTLGATFEKARLDSLAQLADFANGNDLFDLLPDEMKKAGEALGGLSLERLSISLNGGVSADAVQSVSVTVGMPTLEWTVFEGFKVENPAATFTILRPFGQGRRVALAVTGVMEIAGVPFSVTTTAPGLTLFVNLMGTATIPLRSFFEQYLPELPVPTDLTIGSMSLFISPGQQYQLSARMAATPWTLDLGAVPFRITNVALNLSKQAGSSAQGSFTGTLHIGSDMALAMTYATPGSFTIRAYFPEVQLTRLIGALNQIDIPLPSGFDIDLKQSYLMIQEKSGVFSFDAGTMVDGFGYLAFSSRRQGAWGFAVGLDMTNGGLGDLPGLGALKEFEEFIGLEKLMLVLSSLDQMAFPFPDAAAFQAPALGKGSLQYPSSANGLVQGLNFYAQLSTAKNAGFRALAKYLKVKLDGSVGVAIGVSLPNPADKSKFALIVREKINDVTTLNGEMGVALLKEEIAAFLEGKVATRVQGQPMTFDVTALVLENGVLIMGTMVGTLQFDPVQISNMALVIGMDWEGIPSLGIAGTLDVGDFESSVAVFFDSENPANSMVAGAIDGLSLRDVANLIAKQGSLPGPLDAVLASVGLKELHGFNLPGTLAKALDGRDLNAISAAFQQYGSTAFPSTSSQVLLIRNTPGRLWHLTDLTTMLHYKLALQTDGQIEVSLDPQFYFAPRATYIGTLQFPQALYVMGELDYLMLKSKVKVEISPKQGILIDDTIDPIIIYNKDVFAITDATGQSGPRLSLATFSQRNEDPQLAGPHFLVTGRLRMMGADLSKAYVLINKSGLTFRLEQQVGPVVHINLDGSFDSLTNMQAGGAVKVGVKTTLDMGPLGRIPIDVGVAGKLQVSIHGSTASASMGGEFDFAGSHFSTGTFAIAVGADTFRRLDRFMLDQVKAVLSDFLKVADRWVDWVKRGIITGIQGAEAIASVLAKTYGQTAAAVGKTLASMGYAVIDVAKAVQSVFRLDPMGVANALKGAGYAIYDITKALGSLLPGNPNEIARVLLGIGFSPTDVTKALASVLGFSAQAIAGALKAAGVGVDAIAGALKSVFNLGGDAVGQILKAIGVPGEQVARVLKTVFGWSADQVAGFLKDVFGWGSDAVRSTLGAIGYAADQISKALSDVFDWVDHNLNPSNW